MEVDHGDCVASLGLDHIGNLLPLSGEGVELQDVIIVGASVIKVNTALKFISK